LFFRDNDKPTAVSDKTGQLKKEIEEHITEIENKIREYGSFNVIANGIVRTQIASIQHYAKDTNEPSPIIPEYIALICLKFPHSIGIRGFTQARNVA